MLPDGPQNGKESGFRNGDLVGVLVDVTAGKVAFYCNGVLQRWVSGLQTSTPLFPFVSLGAPDVAATFVEGLHEPETPRDFTSRSLSLSNAAPSGMGAGKGWRR